MTIYFYVKKLNNDVTFKIQLIKVDIINTQIN